MNTGLLIVLLLLIFLLVLGMVAFWVQLKRLDYIDRVSLDLGLMAAEEKDKNKNFWLRKQSTWVREQAKDMRTNKYDIQVTLASRLDNAYYNELFTKEEVHKITRIIDQNF